MKTRHLTKDLLDNSREPSPDEKKDPLYQDWIEYKFDDFMKNYALHTKTGLM